MVDYIEALKRPFSDVGKLVLGAILGIVPIINFAVSGYAISAARNTMKKKAALPEWQFGTNWLDGLKMIGINFLYIAPAMLILLIGIAIMAFGSKNLVLILIGALFMLLFGLYCLAVIPMSITAVLRFAEKSRFGAAFEFGEIAKKAYTWKMIGQILAVVGISIGIGFIAGIIPVIGMIAMVLLGPFVLGIFSYTVLATAYIEK